METMKAVQVHSFGGPDALVYEDVPRPIAATDEVLIRVHAVGVNPPDWYLRSGFEMVPERFKATLKLSLPPVPFIPGTDVSGIIEAVGSDVTAFHKGDAVYSLIRFPMGGARAYAEFVAVPMTEVAYKPTTIDHLHTAAVPMSALTVWQALSKYGKIQKGQTILVNGAAGGLGHFAVQMAKLKGTYVIGVASGNHAQFLRSLGVDEVIDYTATSVEKVVHNVDVVIDTVTGGEDKRLLKVIKPGGMLITFGLKYSVEHLTESDVTIQKTQVYSDGTHLAEIANLIDAGHLHVAIDTVVPLAEARKAHERAERGHLQGKIVLSVIA